MIQWFRNNLQKNNLNYKIKWVNDYMFDTELSDIKNNDYIFWNPQIAAKNLSNVMEYKNSIVILEHQTYINEKTSNINPVNENMAVNYGFYLMYLDENEQSTKEWRLAVQQDNYLMTQEQIMQTLLNNPTNYKQEKQERLDVFDDLAEFAKQQVDFDL